MASHVKSKLLMLVDQLIAEGQRVLATQRTQREMGGMVVINPTTYVDTEVSAKWIGGCRNLMRMLSESASPWQAIFSKDDSRLGHARRMQGTLQAIREAIDQDLLVTIRDLVMAEAFSDLLEQADYLLSGGYFLAAGVLGRAVLEEHLRKWCDNAGCAPAKLKPTMNDFKQELQKASKLNKIEIAHVDSMAAVGNTAAHNKPLKQEDVERFIRDVRDFLVRNPAT